MEDLLTEKYVFFKLPKITAFLKKRNQDIDDLKFEVETFALVGMLKKKSRRPCCVFSPARDFKEE